MDDFAEPATIRTRAEFGAGLTALRVAAGLTVRELARRIDRPAGTLGDYLSGRHVPSPAQQSLIVDVLAACGVRDRRDVEAWMAALRRVRASTDRRTTRTSAPYRGLSAFEPEDAALFFGRQESTARILDLIAALRGDPGPSHGLLAVIGPSGSGKSSLLRAGVVASVRNGALDSGGSDDLLDDTVPSEVRWTCEIVTPGRDPVTALTAVLAPGSPSRPRLVVIDQLEEIFTSASAADRAAFLRLLAGCPEDVVVALGMRADFYAEAAREPVLLAPLQHAQVLVGPMTSDQIRAAVVEPATHLGITVDDALVDLLLADLAPHDFVGEAHDPGALPLLSHALLSTWERSSGRRLTIADYRATGGLDASVQRTAEQVYAALPADQQELARNLFLRLVNLDGDVAVTRRRAGRSELGPELRDVVERFVDRRLLTSTASTVEISHEALLTAWPRLHGWLDADRADLAVHRRLTTGANAWDEADRDPALLLSGARLESAQEWAQHGGYAPRLNDLERDFVASGARRRDEQVRVGRRRARRLQQLLVAVGVLALVAVGLAVWARMAQHDADREAAVARSARDDALSRQVAGEARELQQSDPALAEQLALTGYDIAHTTEARSTLIDRSTTPFVTRVLGVPGPTPLALSPDGTLMAVGHDKQGTVHLYRLRSGHVPSPAGVLPAHGGDTSLFALAFAPDGRTLVSAGTGAAVTVWDVADPAHPLLRATLPTGYTEGTETLAVSPDGRTLVAGGSGAHPIDRWDISNPGRPVALPAPRGVPSTTTIHAVAFSPDGTQLGAAGTGAELVWPAAHADSTAPLGAEVAAGRTLYSMVFGRDGDVDTGADDGVISIRRTTAPSLPEVHSEKVAPAFVNALAVSRDGRRLLAGISNNTVMTLDASTLAGMSSTPRQGPVTAVAFTPHDDAVSAAADGTVEIAPPSARTLPTPGTVYNFGWARDGRRLVVGAAGDGGARVYRVASDGSATLTDALTASPAEPAGGTVAVTRTGDLVAAGLTGSTVALWHLDAAGHGTLLGRPFDGGTTQIESLAFDPAGDRLAIGGDNGTVQIWDVHQPGLPHRMVTLHADGAIFNVAFNPAGTLLAGASADTRAYVWAAAPGHQPALLGRLGGFRTYAYGVAFSPNGRLLAVSSADHTTRLWRVSARRRPTAVGSALTGPTDYGWEVSFSADSRRLAVAAGDHLVWVYDVADPARPTVLATLRDLDDTVFGVAFAPSGHTLAAGGRTSQFALWDLDPATLGRQLCTVVGDPITRQEWSLYVPGAPYDPPCG